MIYKCKCGAPKHALEIAPFDDAADAYYVHCMDCNRMGPVAHNDPEMTKCVTLWNEQRTGRKQKPQREKKHG